MAISRFACDAMQSRHNAGILWVLTLAVSILVHSAPVPMEGLGHDLSSLAKVGSSKEVEKMAQGGNQLDHGEDFRSLTPPYEETKQAPKTSDQSNTETFPAQGKISTTTSTLNRGSENALKDLREQHTKDLEKLVETHPPDSFSETEAARVAEHESGLLATEAIRKEIAAFKSFGKGEWDQASHELGLAKEKWLEHYKHQRQIIEKGGGLYDVTTHPEYANALNEHTIIHSSEHTEHAEPTSEILEKSQMFSQGLNEAEAHRTQIYQRLAATVAENRKPDGVKVKGWFSSPNSKSEAGQKILARKKAKIIKDATTSLEYEQKAIEKFRIGNEKGAFKALRQARDLREKYLQNSLKHIQLHAEGLDPLEDAEYQRAMAILNDAKGRKSTPFGGDDANTHTHTVEGETAGSRSWILPILHPEAIGDTKSTLASWNNLPWNEKYSRITRLMIRGNKPSILEEKLARDALFERFQHLTQNRAVSLRQDWFKVQSASRDLEVIEAKRAKEIAKSRAGIGGKIFNALGKIFLPIKYAWKLIRAGARRTGYWLVNKTDANALTPETRLMLEDRDREVTWVGQLARALGGNDAGWVSRKQPQGNASNAFRKAWGVITFKGSKIPPKDVAPL